MNIWEFIDKYHEFFAYCTLAGGVGIFILAATWLDTRTK